MIKTMHGTVRGRSIEIEEDLGLQEGQAVEVKVTATLPFLHQGEGLRRSAGALANDWTEEDDRILAEIHDDRKRPSRREVPE